MHRAAFVAFVAAVTFVAYTHLGYPLLLWIGAKVKRRPTRRESILHKVSVILAVHNEEGLIVQKCRNLLAQDYPKDRLQVVIVSDGSTDGSIEQVRQVQHAQIRLVAYAPRRGKAWALNTGVLEATGELLVFVDARQLLASDAIRHLAENFADPQVGAVSGEMQLLSEGNEFGHAMDAYWNYEKWIRRTESEIDSVCGVTGCLWAMRKRLFSPMPEGILLDDLFLPMEIVRQGYRVIFDSRAIAYDWPSKDSQMEYQRKRRTLLGNYQLLKASPWLLTSENRIRFQFVSHKVCRLLVPFFLLVLLVSSLFSEGPAFRALFFTQLGFYLLAIFDRWIPSGTLLRKLSSLANYFLIAHLGALSGLVFWLLGRKDVWTKAQNYGPQPRDPS